MEGARGKGGGRGDGVIDEKKGGEMKESVLERGRCDGESETGGISNGTKMEIGVRC